MSAIDDRILEVWLKSDGTSLQPELAKLDALLSRTLVPAVFLSKSPNEHSERARGCWLGGRPRLPEYIDWPWVVDGENPIYPMNFLAQFDLAQLPKSAFQRGLPESGTLFFFASYVEDVEYGKSSVIFIDEDVSDVALRMPPGMPETLKNVSEMLWWTRNPRASFDHCPVKLVEYQAIDPNALLTKNEQRDSAAYEIACRAYDLQCKKLQSSILDKQNLSNRLSNWFKEQKRKQPTTEDTMHRLLSGDTGYGTVGPPDQDVVRLLTVDHDPSWGFEYACGTLAFFIRVEDLAELRFSAAFATQE